MTVQLTHFLFLTLLLYFLGLCGIIFNHRKIITVLIAIELILLGINLNFIVFSVFMDDLIGQVFALFVLTVAAAESAIGLAILVVYYRVRGTISMDSVTLMQG